MAAAKAGAAKASGKADEYVGPLKGIRVLDCSRLLPGPFATQILRDLGAEVIKVEDNAGGDYARYYPPAAVDGSGAQFHGLNRGKKSIVLDFKQPADRQSFLALAATADVVIESFRPGVMARLGVGYEQLKAVNPAIVYCAISGYGATGPDSQRAGHDMNYLARAGVYGMMATPVVLPVQVADIAGGALPAVIQILAALRAREREGVGANIDVSMTDNSYALLTMPHARYSAQADSPIGGGSDVLCGAYPCYELYRTADGHLSVGSLEPKFWKALCSALQQPDLVDKQFSTGDEGAAVKQKLTQIFTAKPTAHWTALFRKPEFDACVEPINRPESVATADPQLRARDLNISFTVQPKADSGDAPQTVTAPKMPLRMTGISPPALPAPTLGQHTAEILATLPKGSAAAAAAGAGAGAAGKKPRSKL